MFWFVVCSRTCDFVDRTQQFDLSYVYDSCEFLCLLICWNKEVIDCLHRISVANRSLQSLKFFGVTMLLSLL